MDEMTIIMKNILAELKIINKKIEKWENIYEKNKLLDEGVKEAQALLKMLR